MPFCFSHNASRQLGSIPEVAYQVKCYSDCSSENAIQRNRCVFDATRRLIKETRQQKPRSYHDQHRSNDLECATPAMDGVLDIQTEADVHERVQQQVDAPAEIT